MSKRSALSVLGTRKAGSYGDGIIITGLTDVF